MTECIKKETYQENKSLINMDKTEKEDNTNSLTSLINEYNNFIVEEQKNYLFNLMAY